MSTELDTLFIRIQLETDDVKKGVEQALTQIKNLENEFGKLSRSGDAVNESFRKIARSTVAMFAGFASFSAVLSGAASAISAVRDVGKAASQLNVDVTALDAWGHAVQRTGGSAQQFQTSLASLATHFQTTNDVALRSLPRLANLFSKLNPRQAQLYGKSLGLDLPTIMLLQQGRREVEAVVSQQQRLGLVTKEQTEITRKFDNALYDASRAYQTFYRELAIPLLPGITQGLGYIIEHKDVLIDAFKGIALAVGALGVALINISPIFKLAAAVTGIATAYGIIKEDIGFFKEGKDSLFGQVLGVKPDPKTSNDFVNNAVGRGAGGAFLDIPSQFLNSLTGGFIGGGSQKTEVTINEVNINTAATDAEGIAAAARGSLQNALGQLTSQVDNGVFA